MCEANAARDLPTSGDGLALPRPDNNFTIACRTRFVGITVPPVSDPEYFELGRSRNLIE